MTTKREWERQTAQENTLMGLGFTRTEADSLRRISMTLQRWFERECGTEDGWVIERDGENGDGKPFLSNGSHRYAIPDREAGARKRLALILADRNQRTTGPALWAYIQTDPRGAALYIIRPGDVPDGQDPHAYYSRGIVVY